MSNSKTEIVKIVFTSRNYQLKKCAWGLKTCVKGTAGVCLLSAFQGLMMVSVTYLESDQV